MRMKASCLLRSACLIIVVVAIASCSSDSPADIPDGDSDTEAVTEAEPDVVEEEIAPDGDMDEELPAELEAELPTEAEVEVEPEAESEPELSCDNPVIWYRDDDRDGFGLENDTQEFCEDPGQGWSQIFGDCHDDNELAFPGSHAIEIPGDGVDMDCDGIDACRDLNCDGWPDIVFANTDHDGAYAIDSYVYLGGADGYREDRRWNIPTVGGMGADSGDFNRDGYIDLVFAHVQNGESRDITSYVYYGSADGLLVENRIELPTIGCADPTVADVNADGWPDLIFNNRYAGSDEGSGMPNPNDYKINSYIYWGGESGFSIDNRLELPTVGAARARVADLNKDGFNDIVFANGVMQLIGSESYIYWGSAAGWGEGNRSTFKSQFPEGLEVADINADGNLDILVTSWMCMLCEGTYIYWGDDSGSYSDDRRESLDGSVGATGAAVADLNADGFNDIVIPNGAVNAVTQEFAQESYIYWGNADGFAEDNRTVLPTSAASDCAIRDLDGDGRLDVVFSSHYPPSEGAPEFSEIYWGDENGYSVMHRTQLPTQHAAGMTVVGSVYLP